jgi:hypothetical protein
VLQVLDAVGQAGDDHVVIPRKMRNLIIGSYLVTTIGGEGDALGQE